MMELLILIIPLKEFQKQFQKASVEHADLIITPSGDCGKVAYVDAISDRRL